MTRVTVLIDVIAGGEGQPDRCFDASASADRRKQDRRHRNGNRGWQQDWTRGQPAEVRAYRFRSFADRRAKQEGEATAGSSTSFRPHHEPFRAEGGGASIGCRGQEGSSPEVSPRADREEILIRVLNDRSGFSGGWLHVEL